MLKDRARQNCTLRHYCALAIYQTQENPYLAAIKDIDPDIIKFDEVFEEDTS
jgi:hypothetical protein